MYEAILAALADGSLRPLPVTVFPLARSADALRYMAQARHVGKVVVRSPPTIAGGSARHLRPATYWITGGLGALGLETAEWLVKLRRAPSGADRPPSAEPTRDRRIHDLEPRGVGPRVSGQRRGPRPGRPS